MWTPEDRIEITPNGRRALNRAKDNREQQPDPLDERPELVENVNHGLQAADCRQRSNLYDIANAVAQFMEDHRNG